MVYDDTGLLREVEYGHTPTAPDPDYPDYPDYPDQEPINSQPQQPPPPVSRATEPARTNVIRLPRPQPSGFEQPRSQHQPRFVVRPPPQRPTFQAQVAAPPQQPAFRPAPPQHQFHPFLTNTIDWAKGVYSYKY